MLEFNTNSTSMRDGKIEKENSQRNNHMIQNLLGLVTCLRLRSCNNFTMLKRKKYRDSNTFFNIASPNLKRQINRQNALLVPKIYPISTIYPSSFK